MKVRTETQPDPDHVTLNPFAEQIEMSAMVKKREQKSLFTQSMGHCGESGHEQWNGEWLLVEVI